MDIEGFTLQQYRDLVEYLSSIPLSAPPVSLEDAMRRFGITASPEDVDFELFKAGWMWDENSSRLYFEDDDE